MSDYRRPQPENDCPPRPKDPADQPHPPGVDKCQDLPPTTPPKLKDPEKCVPDCDCPRTPPTDTNCLEQLISQQGAEIAAAEKAKAFKADLEALLVKAKAAGQEYTRREVRKARQAVGGTGHGDRRARAKGDLRAAVLALRHRVLHLPAPERHALCRAGARRRRHASTPRSTTSTTCSTGGRATRKRRNGRFNRIKTVLAAWEKPAATIEKVLTDNQALIDSIGKLVGTDPGRAVYDVFLRSCRCTWRLRPRATPIGRRESPRSTRSSASATRASRLTAAALTSAN